MTSGAMTSPFPTARRVQFLLQEVRERPAVQLFSLPNPTASRLGDALLTCAISFFSQAFTKRQQ